MKHIISNHPGDMLKNFCSTIHILCGFNNFHLVGHNCLRISNTSDAAAFIKSCLIHHHPDYNWPARPKLLSSHLSKTSNLISIIRLPFSYLIGRSRENLKFVGWGSIFKLANSCSLVLTQLGTCSGPHRILHWMRFGQLFINSQLWIKRVLKFLWNVFWSVEPRQEYPLLQMIQNPLHNKQALAENFSHFCLQTFLLILFKLQVLHRESGNFQ